MKVMIIGWDGGSYRFINERFNDFKFLSSIADRVGHLYPTRRYVGAWIDSGLSWTTLMSGLPPEVHGVLSVHCVRMSMRDKLKAGGSADRKGGEGPRLGIVKVKRIWDYLTERGYSCGVVNVPITYPPTPVNGFMVSGLFAEPTHYTHPEDLWKKLNAMGYRPDILPKMGAWLHWHDYREMLGSAESERDDIRDVMEKRFECTKWLLKNYETDFFIVNFMALDSIQHRFYGDEAVLTEFYMRADEMSGELVKMANPKNLIVLSDHGMKKADKFGRIMTLSTEFKLFLIKAFIKYVVSMDANELVGMAKTFWAKGQRGNHDSTDGFYVIRGWDNRADLCHTDIVPMVKRMMRSD